MIRMKQDFLEGGLLLLNKSSLFLRSYHFMSSLLIDLESIIFAPVA